MTLKKLVSGLICSSIILSNTAFIHAENLTQETDHWNTTLVDEVAKDVYEDFPLVIDKSLGRDMNLSISMQYLKNIDEDDEVMISVFNNTDKTLVGEYDLSENDTFVILENIDNDKTYLVSVSENLDNTQKDYMGKIDTKFVPAAFPVDLTLGNIEYNNNNGETFNHVAIKKVGDNPICNHSEDEECTENCSMASVIDKIMPSDLNTFYSELDENEFYEIQVEAGSDIKPSDIYRGFISTYPDGDEMGVFTPGYSFEVIENTSQIQTEIIDFGNNTEYSLQGYADPSIYNFSSAFTYTMYENEYGSLTGSNYIIVKWTVPQTDDYCIETIGNADLQYWRFDANDNGSVTNSGERVMSGGVGSNPSATYTFLAGQTMYFVIRVQSGSGGAFAFRIKWADISDSDGISGYRDEVQAAYDAGNFSPTTNECYLNYHGDVNYFAYNVSTGLGYLRFINTNVVLSAKVLSKYGRTNNIDDVWEEAGYTVDYDQDIAHSFVSGVHYIKVAEISPPGANDNAYYEDSFIGEYDFAFGDPMMKDSFEMTANATYGDVPNYPIAITLPYYNNTRTLHKNDIDTYTFTTGTDVGRISIILIDPVTCDEYSIGLYGSVTTSTTSSTVSWSFPTSLGTITESMIGGRYSKTLVYDNLLPNHTYYVAVTPEDSNKYSSLHDYIIDIDIDLSNPTAIFSENVALTYTIGTQLTDLSSFLDAIMEKLTCTLYGETVADSIAVSNVELYIGETLLTTAYVQTLTAGEYTVTVKYDGQTATGGTVTLTVNAATVTEDKVEIALTNAEFEDIEEYDWLNCAKLLADFKLAKAGLPASTISKDDVAELMEIDIDEPVRGKLSETLEATAWFYTNGTSDSTSGLFKRVTTSSMLTEDNLYGIVSGGNIAIIQLKDVTAGSDTTKMRYLIVCGVNRTTHKLKLFDCMNGNNLIAWYDTSDIINGGFVTDTNVKFSGYVIEIV